MVDWRTILKKYDLPILADFEHPNSPAIKRGLFLANYFADNESELNEQVEEAMAIERSEDSLRRAVYEILDGIPNKESVDFSILINRLKLDTWRGFSEHQNNIPYAIIRVLEDIDEEFSLQERDAN
jgi:hypothetical protein